MPGYRTFNRYARKLCLEACISQTTHRVNVRPLQIALHWSNLLKIFFYYGSINNISALPFSGLGGNGDSDVGALEISLHCLWRRFTLEIELEIVKSLFSPPSPALPLLFPLYYTICDCFFHFVMYCLSVILAPDRMLCSFPFKWTQYIPHCLRILWCPGCN